MIEHMFDSPATLCPAPPPREELRGLLSRCAAIDGSGLPEAELIDHLGLLEQLKSAAAAAQARVTATLVATRSRAEAEAGVPVGKRCRGLGAEVALARRDSPARGGRHLGLATALVHEMPQTLAALTRGQISEWRATVMVRETAVLTREHRSQVDAELAGRLSMLGDRGVAAAARTVGYRLDPGSVLRRARGAHADRRVGLRPAPDTMTHLTGFLPVAQGVACKVALEKHADRLRAQGDPRTRGQLMADALVERVTGVGEAGSVDVEVQVVMTDTSLLGDDHTPARLAGYGPIPAGIAHDLVRAADRAWLRRLFTGPDSSGGSGLVAMDSRRRLFTGGLRRFVVTRDDVCRSAWCDAPIRHVDHVLRVADGGRTRAEDAQGLCEACNYAKEAVGWRARRPPGRSGVVETTTPTGHRYVTRPPDLPGARSCLPSTREQRFRTEVLAA